MRVAMKKVAQAVGATVLAASLFGSSSVSAAPANVIPEPSSIEVPAASAMKCSLSVKAPYRVKPPGPGVAASSTLKCPQKVTVQTRISLFRNGKRVTNKFVENYSTTLKVSTLRRGTGCANYQVRVHAVAKKSGVFVYSKTHTSATKRVCS